MSVHINNGSLNSPAVTMETDVITFKEMPLTALSKKTLRRLSLLLNSKKILRSEEGYERDWRGLASLSKQKFLCNENTTGGDDPTTKVIKLWCTNNPKTATFAYLGQFLGIIDRWDVSDDIFENLVEDTKTYRSKPSLVSDSNENSDINAGNACGDFGHGSDSNILTTSDVIRAQKGLTPQIYDAFVLYADADINYATEMLTKLEDNPEYNFKLCLKDRDLLGGVQFEHVALTQLIEERCKHLIVILTAEFLKSPENRFLVNYTQAQQIQHKTRKIVPLLYDECVDIPKTLKIYTHLRYNMNSGSLFNFWSKLANSIQNVNVKTRDIMTISSPLCISNINRTTSNTTACRNQILSSTPPLIPSINIIRPDKCEEMRKKERSELTTLKQDNLTELHTTSYQKQYSASMSDVSTTTSVCSGKTKKKRKWSTKILKRFSS